MCILFSGENQNNTNYSSDNLNTFIFVFFKYITQTIYNLHSPKMKTSHFYNGIYDAWGKHHYIPPNAGSGIQSFVGMLNYSVGE